MNLLSKEICTDLIRLSVQWIVNCILLYTVHMLCYKSEGRWFDSRWCHWNFSLT